MFATLPYRGATRAAIAPRSLGKPPAAFPGRVATDADLMIAVDRQQTRLTSPLDASATSMTVENAAAIGAYNLLTIDSEIVKTTGAASGNVVPISRGFDGTAPASHIAGSIVSGFVDAYHHNSLAAEIQAVEQALGANLGNVPGVPPYVITPPYDFTPIVIGGSISAGLQTITIAPVPRGVNGGNIGQMLWISGGTGTPEAVPIVGGGAMAGAASGTLFLQLANAHSGSWTIESASDGIQEAIIDAGPGKLIFIPSGAYSIRGQVVTPHDNQSIQGAGRDQTVLTVANGSNTARVFRTGSSQNITLGGIGFEGNFVNQTHPSGVLNTCIDGTSSRGLRIMDCRFHGFGYTLPADAGWTQVISLYSAKNCEVSGCLFLSNLAYEINLNAAMGVSIFNNQFGSPYMQDARTPTDWWDSYGGGMGTLCIDTDYLFFTGNRMFGSARAATLAGVLHGFGYLISSGGGYVQMQDIKIQDNEFHGLGNSRGTVSVTNGSGIVTGANTVFWSGDVHRSFQVEGDNTDYRITGYTSPTQITVTPPITRASGSNLRHFFQNSGDVISVGPANNILISGNAVYDSGDMGYDLGGLAGSSTQHLIVANNIACRCQVAGLYMGGPIFDAIISGNLFINCCRKQLAGHQGAIEISPTNQGATTPSDIWQITFSNNRFLDDQGAATQLYGFHFEVGQDAKVFGCSFHDNTYFAYAGGIGLFNPETTPAMQGRIFDIPAVSASARYLTVAFADLNGIDRFAPVNGTVVYCFDAKSVLDGAAAGAVAVGGGTGAICLRLNNKWIAN